MSMTDGSEFLNIACSNDKKDKHDNSKNEIKYTEKEFLLAEIYNLKKRIEHLESINDKLLSIIDRIIDI